MGILHVNGAYVYTDISPIIYNLISPYPNLIISICNAGSFAGLTFLAWYMSGKLRVFDRRGHVAKLCIVLIPVLIAILVGISRVDDYWHHWTDVFAGALIGFLILKF